MKSILGNYTPFITYYQKAKLTFNCFFQLIESVEGALKILYKKDVDYNCNSN